jgi:MFS transporter, DHA1 family, multidrug resistance protein
MLPVGQSPACTIRWSKPITREIPDVRIPPASVTFTLLLGFLVALPAFGIDMSLPALSAIGAAFGSAPSQVGLMMSLFMLGFAITPLFYGPASDRFGRKPMAVLGCSLFTIASVGCVAAPSLPALLVWRAVQGAGAGASITIALAIIRDLFEGQAARARLSYVTIATMIVPMIAPTAGAALLALGGWRTIQAVLAGTSMLLLLAISIGFAESARLDPANRLAPIVVLNNYLRVLTHPVCAAYILVNAAGFGCLFAYVSGSSLVLINVVGLRPQQYALLFGATSFAILAGAFVNGRLTAMNIAPDYPLIIGLSLAAVSAISLLALTLTAWTPLSLLISLLVLANFGFGLIAPNALQAAMQPLPQIAGAASAVIGFVQMTTAAVVSGLVTVLFDGRSALSMTAPMALCSLLALAGYLLLARRAERIGA